VTTPDTILATRPANLLALWTQGEASGTVVTDASGNGRTGTYHGVDLAQPGIEDGLTSAFYGGTGDYTDVYSASLAAAFNGGEVSVLLFFKVANVGVWSDGANRRLLTFQISSSNRILIQKNTTTGLNVIYTAGGSAKTLSKTDITTNTDWICVLLTASKTANVAKMYINGVLSATSTGNLGTWAGTLLSTNTVIGSSGTTPTQVFNGWIGPVAIWDTALTADDALALASPTIEEPDPEPAATFTFRDRPLVFTFRDRPLTFTFRERP
jgi:hypothetical protein